MSSLIRRVTVAGFATALGVTSLAACGSNSSDSSGGGSGGSDISAACNLSNPPQSGAEAPSAGGSSQKVSGKVGVILPDTTSSNRYTEYDAPLLTKALKDAGITPDVQNAQGDKNKFASIAQSMIDDGVKVLIIDSIDAASGAGVEKVADKAGVKVIDYDRVNLGGTAPYYVSFDNEDVGKLQAQTMLDCLKQQGIDNPKIIMMNGGTDVDNNAVLFQKGAHEVLDSSGADIVSEQVVKGWDVANAAPAFTQALNSAGGEVDGVLAANDGIAGAVIGVLKNNGLDGKVVVTGQDSTAAGLADVVAGKQSMTIFKNVKLEANAAAQLAIALIGGTDPSQAGLTLAKFDDPQSSGHDLQALLLPAQVITQGQVQDVIDAGALSASDICKDVQSDCDKLGIS